MCLLLIAIDAVDDAPLVVLGNRDEFHARASAPAAPWPQHSHVAGGRDLVAGGSWMALSSEGRFAAVTNVRRAVVATSARSRGWLVRDFVLGDIAPRAFVARMAGAVDQYGPCNLIVADRDGVAAWDGGVDRSRVLTRGIHLISNGAINEDWPKTVRLRTAFERMLAGDPALLDDSMLLDLLLDETPAVNAILPDTGVGLAVERRLAPILIRGDGYGTRASTLLRRNAHGISRIVERRFGPMGASDGVSQWQALPMHAFTH